MDEPIPILANHCHLMPPNSWRPGDRDMLLRHLDALGIDSAVVFAPFAVQMGGDLWRANAWVLEQVAGSPRLIPFATICPVHPEATAVLERMHAAGVRGCKVHPAIEPYDLTEPRAMAFYAAAADLGVVLDFHTGVHHSPLALSDPLKFDSMLWSVPGLRIILEHAGGRAFYEMMLAIAANHGGASPRAFLGVTSVLEHDNWEWHLGPARVKEMAECVGAAQLVFGLDFPWHSLDDNRAALEALRGMGLPRAGLEALLGGTLRRLLGLAGP